MAPAVGPVQSANYAYFIMRWQLQMAIVSIGCQIYTQLVQCTMIKVKKVKYNLGLQITLPCQSKLGRKVGGEQNPSLINGVVLISAVLGRSRL